MNKKLMALAVAGALAAPAATAVAQTSTVQISGSFTTLWYYHSPNNSRTGGKGDMLHMSEPNIRISGQEKLGGGHTIWFQCESEADLISAEGFGLCVRNSGIGFRGGYGNFFVGNWDTPHKLMTNRIRGAHSGTNALFGGGSRILHNGAGSGMANSSLQVAHPQAEGSNATSFFRRQANSVNYHSPRWNGFQVMGMFSSANENTGLGSSTLRPRMYSLAAHYDSGPLYIGAAYEQHQDYNPAGVAVGLIGPAGTYNGGDDTSWQIGAGYTFGGNVKLTAMYTENKYETGRTTNLKVDGFAVYLDWKLAGPHTVRAAYAKVGDGKGAAGQRVGFYTTGNNTGADWWNVHYEYAFSKRTQGLVSYNRISNDASTSRFSLGKTPGSTGNSQSAIGVGLKHRF